ncbi:MAG: hypothetical protein IPH07_20950 [Deltaproteobacteria bacterium]|nr:hypothetical protein [Deltaproteobacteria bacterium]MBK8239840.1 hypothetical protein [Deltaproteobacteria bacterium]MBK8716185.1 hypothetical protein [Deltaproteobacteria bacterium]MBP7289455.1 hypothetical protein [Nannocystaceae bacterium]
MRSAAAIACVCLSVAAAVSCDDPTITEVPRTDALDELTRAFCERHLRCECEDYRVYESTMECVGDLEEGLAELDAQLQVVGVVYDADCVGAYVRALDERGCGGWEAPSETCERPCKFAHGQARIGETCEQDFHCAQGLVCAYDDTYADYRTICIDPCVATSGPSCVNAPCAVGQVCDWDNARCVAPPGAGETCVAGECAQGLFCRFDPMAQTAICFAPAPIGEACMGHGECDSGYCPAGFCATRPGRGETCEAGVCTDELWCNPENTRCETAPPPRPAICDEAVQP